MSKQLLFAALAAITLGLSAVSLAQMSPPPLDPAVRALPQCAGLTGNARDACLRQPGVRTFAPSDVRIGVPEQGGTPGFGGTGSIGGGSSSSGQPRQ